MSSCSKCGTELIGAKKFCAACGQPVGDPRAADVPAVDPLGATALPGVKSPLAAPPSVAGGPAASVQDAYGPPPASAGAGAPRPPMPTGPQPPTGTTPEGSGPPTVGYGSTPPSHRQPTSAASPVAIHATYTSTNQGGHGLPVLSPPASGHGAPSLPDAATTTPDAALAPTDPAAVPSRAPSTPGVGEAAASRVSPLAVSGLNADRAALDEAEASLAGAKKKIPGTQVMNAPPSFMASSVPQPSAPAPDAAPPAKRQDKTQVLGFQIPGVVGVMPGASPGAAAGAGAPPATQGGPAPSAHASGFGVAPSTAQPPPAQIPPPAPAYGAPPPPHHAGAAPGYGGAPVYPQTPAAPMAPVAPMAPAAPVAPMAPAAPMAPVAPMAPGGTAGAQPAWGFTGYAPGARVNVTWSNGMQYPATVQQVTGGRCLVAFPDGQQHWVDMQYVAPA